MQTIKIRSRVDADGILRLNVPLELANQEIEIVVVYQLVEPVISNATDSESSDVIQLSQKDSMAFVESLLNPPESSDKMRNYAQDYKRSTLS